MADTRGERILKTLRSQRRQYDSSVVKIPDHDDTVRELTRKANLDPRNIGGNRIIAIRPR